MLIKSCFGKAFLPIILFSILSSVSNAQTFSEIDIQVVFNINWASNPSQNEINLGMNSTVDTWTTRFTIYGNSVHTSTSCKKGRCSSSAFASAHYNGNINTSVQSSTEPNLSLAAFNYDAFRNFDEFAYFSDGAAGAGDYVVLSDVINGVYAKPNGNQLESWLLEREILGLNVSGQIAANSQALVQFLNSGNATFEVQESFLNHLQQISYSKNGTATVANVLVINAQNNPYPLECTYEVASDWGHGFQSVATLKNVSTTTVQNWLVNLKFDHTVYVNDYWNAAISSFNPYFVATGQSWNKTIYPGQEVNFGFLGSKASSQNANAIISGKLCR